MIEKEQKKPHSQTNKENQNISFCMFLAVVTLWHDRVLLNFLAHAVYIQSAMLPEGKYPWNRDFFIKVIAIAVSVCNLCILCHCLVTWKELVLWGKKKCSSILQCTIKYCNYVLQFLTSLYIYISEHSCFEGFCFLGTLLRTVMHHFL